VSADVIFKVGSWFLLLVFNAGIAWKVLKDTRRDVNGLGKKYRDVTALLLKWADTPEKRNDVCDMMKGK
jgi:hypothetical protein